MFYPLKVPAPTRTTGEKKITEAFFKTARWNPFIPSAFERYGYFLLRTPKFSEIGRVVLKNELPKL